MLVRDNYYYFYFIIFFFLWLLLIARIMEVFDFEKFIANPSSDYLKVCKVRKVDWLALGEYVEVVVKSYWPKQKLIDTIVPVLVSSGLVSDEAYDLVTSDGKSDDDAELERIKLQIKHKELEIEAVRSNEREKALEVDRLKLENDRIKFEKDAELDKLRLEKETDLELKKLEDLAKIVKKRDCFSRKFLTKLVNCLLTLRRVPIEFPIKMILIWLSSRERYQNLMKMSQMNFFSCLRK